VNLTTTWSPESGKLYNIYVFVDPKDCIHERNESNNLKSNNYPDEENNAATIVALQAANGQYLCAEGSRGGAVVANRNAIGAWEIFKLIDRGNGSVALQAANGQYLCAEGSGGGAVVANRNAIGAWETFELISK
jgi:hypothetical protein